MKNLKIGLLNLAVVVALWGDKVDENKYYRNVMETVLSVTIDYKDTFDHCLVEVYSNPEKQYLLISIYKGDYTKRSLFELSSDGVVIRELSYRSFAKCGENYIIEKDRVKRVFSAHGIGVMS